MSSPSVTPGNPIELTLGDGSVVKGANLEEAFQNLVKAKENASSAIRSTRDELEAERQRAAQLAQENERLKHPPQVNKDGSFNKNRFYELLNGEPEESLDYYFEHRFGVKPAEFNASFQQVQAKVNEFNAGQVTAAFLAQHEADYPPTPEAAKALTGKVQSLTQNGVPFNLDTMNYAYYELVSNGTIKPNEPETEQESPNPSLGGGGNQALPSDISRADSMSDKDLEALLRSKGVLR